MKKLWMIAPFLLSMAACAGSKNTTMYFNVYDDGTAAVAVNTSYAVEDVVIPETVEYNGRSYPVTGIVQDAFKGNSFIRSVTFSDTVISSGWDAFRGCRNLETVDLGSGISVLADHMFAECSRLSRLSGGAGVRTIYKGVFEGTKLTELAFDALETVSETSFQNMEYLQTAVLQGTYASLPASAFSGCGSLREVELSYTCAEIGAYAFFNCSSLTDVSFASVRTIRSSAFENCGFEVVRLKDASIGPRAFYGNAALTEVTVEGGEILYKAFAGNKALEAASISGVEVIASQAFQGDALRRIDIDGTLRRIESEAFADNAIAEITFSGTSSLEAIHRKAFCNNPLQGSIEFPSSLRRIYKYAFAQTGLTQASCAADTWIDEEAFEASCALMRIKTDL